MKEKSIFFEFCLLLWFAIFQAPDGESQPMTDVDLFISIEKIMVLNVDIQDILMDHPLRTISYIADSQYHGFLSFFLRKMSFHSLIFELMWFVFQLVIWLYWWLNEDWRISVVML